MDKRNLEKLTDHLWEIPKSFRGDMRVPQLLKVALKEFKILWRDVNENIGGGQYGKFVARQSIETVRVSSH